MAITIQGRLSLLPYGMVAKLKAFKAELQRRMHEPVTEVGE
jgi:hypothetical protein